MGHCWAANLAAIVGIIIHVKEVLFAVLQAYANGGGAAVQATGAWHARAAGLTPIVRV
jgi:hypothetical protein